MSSHLEKLESEAIYIFREATASFENLALLFSGGKDSTVMLHLAMRAFWPEGIPFSLLHIDTGHNFPEVIKFRDEQVQKHELDLEIGYVQDSIDKETAKEDSTGSRNRLQSITLLESIQELELDAVFGGGRRDEEKARAKERIFSLRKNHGGWVPEEQNLELWKLYRTHKKDDEHFRVFPISNWTEKDIWDYIQYRKIDVSELYYSHPREGVERSGIFYPKSEFIELNDGESYQMKNIRFRTVGDISCSTAIESQAINASEVIEELGTLKVTERGSRVDDRFSESAMEDRKREGYF